MIFPIDYPERVMANSQSRIRTPPLTEADQPVFEVLKPSNSSTVLHQSIVSWLRTLPPSGQPTKDIAAPQITEESTRMAAVSEPIDQPSADSTAPTQTSSRRSKTLVESSRYRKLNLRHNNVCLLDVRTPLPEFVQQCADLILRDELEVQGLDELDEASTWWKLEWGAAENELELFLSKYRVFPLPESDSVIQRADRVPFFKDILPNKSPDFRLSTPAPNIAYGYNLDRFSLQQSTIAANMSVNTAGLICPFLIVEGKGDAATGSGSIWVAQNQCVGGVATSISCSVKTIGNSSSAQNVVFGLVINPHVAKLYIGWFEDDDDEEKINFRRLSSYLMDDVDQYQQFRAHISGIFTWASTTRLEDLKTRINTRLQAHSEVTQGQPEATQAVEIEQDTQPPRKRQRRSPSRYGYDGPSHT